MGTLITKGVHFNGSILRAAQTSDGTVWIGVRWVCEGIGLTEGQQNRQVLNIKKDAVLSQGIDYLYFVPGKRTMCIKLDFLPLWLAKIPITPKMKKEVPEVVKNLIEYQIKAKDVLSDAFFNSVVDKRMPIAEQIAQIKGQIDLLYTDMTKLCNLVLDRESKKEITVVDNSAEEFYQEWKSSIYGLIEKAKRDRMETLNSIYAYMTKNYGVVWMQEIKEMRDTSEKGRIPYLHIIYENETYRSIFESVLKDMLEKKFSIDDIIAPLIERKQDKSNGGMHTLRKVYSEMGKNQEVDWNKFNMKYYKDTGKLPKRRKELIIQYPVLQKKLQAAVKEMLKN